MNQHRCETCKKPHRVPNGLSRFPIFECCGEEMPFDTAISTGMRGCASHSDFQSGWDTVLDEAIAYCKNRESMNKSLHITYHHETYFARETEAEVIRQHFEELLQAGSP